MTVQDSAHIFFTCGLVYSTFFCIYRTFVEVFRWFSRSRKSLADLLADPSDSAESFGDRAERDVEEALRNFGIPTLRNVYLHDPDGRLTEIDLLALVGRKILVIEVKAWVGQIVGKQHDNEWVQIKARGDKKVMSNPLEQNGHHLRIFRTALPKSTSEGIVVFAKGTFADGMPSGVVHVSGLLAVVEQLRRTEPDDATLLAWGMLSNWSMRQNKAELQRALMSQIRSRNAPIMAEGTI